MLGLYKSSARNVQKMRICACVIDLKVNFSGSIGVNSSIHSFTPVLAWKCWLKAAGKSGVSIRVLARPAEAEVG